MMTPLMTLLLLSVVVSVMAAPHWDNPVTDVKTVMDNSSKEVNLNAVSFDEQALRHIKKINDAKETKNLKDDFNTPNSQEFVVGQKFPKVSKKSRKHKNFFFNYPYIPQINKFPSISSALSDNHNDLIQEKTIGYRKKQQESNIFYVRLPPTPYYFVPGLGYISNPPKFSTSSIRPHPLNNAKPHSHHHNHKHHHHHYHQHQNSHNKNPFINLPIDFVSNGKPTSVYQWENSNRKSSKTTINKLNKGPYGFNGRPTSLYLLTSDGEATMHQPIRYNDIRGNNIY